MESDAPVPGYEYGRDATLRATELALARADRARRVLLVEGITDQIAVETVAERLGRDVGAEGLVVVPMGGAHAAKQFIPHFLAKGVEVRGLVDRNEAGEFAAALGVSRVDDLARHGVRICVPDLEFELIGALEPAELEALLDREGDLRSFRTLQKQPNWRDRPFAEQLHRWLRSVSDRGPRYARLLIEAAPDDRLPAPLRAVVE